MLPTGTKGPPARSARAQPRGEPLVPVRGKPGLKGGGGFSPASVVPVGHPGLKALTNRD